MEVSISYLSPCSTDTVILKRGALKVSETLISLQAFQGHLNIKDDFFYTEISSGNTSRALYIFCFFLLENITSLKTNNFQRIFMESYFWEKLILAGTTNVERSSPTIALVVSLPLQTLVLFKSLI